MLIIPSQADNFFGHKSGTYCTIPFLSEWDD